MLQALKVLQVPQALKVLLETEHPSIVKSNAFEYAVTIQESVVEYGNFGFGFRVENAVYVDLHQGCGGNEIVGSKS